MLKSRLVWKVRIGVIGAGIVLGIFAAAEGRVSGQTVPLYPLVYYSHGGDRTDIEAVCSLFGYHACREEVSIRVFPVFRGPGYFHVFPLFWSSHGNWLLIPFGGEWGNKKSVGLVWWWAPDMAVLFPIFWAKNGNWILVPAAGRFDDFHFVGPVMWGDGYFHLFPLLWTWANGAQWFMFPIAGRFGETTVAGPVWVGRESVTVFPVFWWRDKGRTWVLFPIAGRTKNSVLVGPVLVSPHRVSVIPVFSANPHGWWFLLGLAHGGGGKTRIGPVWWRVPTSEHDQFSCGVFPIFLAGRNRFLLFPLASIHKRSGAVGPVWWGSTYFCVLPLWLHWNFGDGNETKTFIPPLLAWSHMKKYEEPRSSFSLFIRLIHWERRRKGYRFELQPIFNVATGEVHHFGLFWRLFEYHRDADERYWRILFLPHKFRLH